MLPYVESLMRLQESALQVGLKHDFLFTRNESLITRGRDTSATRFLATDFDYLMFIDADIEFSADDVAKLWNLQADICAGLYPMKNIESPLMAWRDQGKGMELLPVTEEGLMEVNLVGTGFLMIHRRVFEKLQELHPDWEYVEGRMGDNGGPGACWGFFQDPLEIVDGSRVHLSEDYFFCRRAIEAGFKIIADTSIKLKHWGLYGFTGRPA